MMKNNFYKIYKRGLCNELLKEGFKLVEVVEHYRNRDKTIFLFDNTEELTEYLKKKEIIKSNP